MSFELTELQLEILRIVDALQHGKDRQDVRDGSSVVLRDGVPETIILAELHGLGGDGRCESDVLAALDESTTRKWLKQAMMDHSQWPSVKYVRPAGKELSTQIDPDTRLREVTLDGKCVALEFDERCRPTAPFACYSITREGLEALDSDGRDEATTTDVPDNVSEHTDVEQQTDIANPSAPLTKKQAATNWGGDMNVKKLSSLMESSVVTHIICHVMALGVLGPSREDPSHAPSCFHCAYGR